MISVEICIVFSFHLSKQKLMPDYHDEGPADLYSITLASLLAAAVQSRTAKWEDEIH